MKTALFYLVLGFLALTLVLPQAAFSQPEPEETPPAIPVMRIDEEAFMAGEIKSGFTITHDFIVKNIGQAELIIRDVIPGCGCIVANFTPVINPGSQGTITLAVDVYPEWAGHEIDKAALVLTNDPVNPNTKIFIKAKIVANRSQS
ncbi:MAG: DUF1573 domain-containing protein [Deltaproteobacteria bacterium]|jgi:hypothetical protein|nr:DUF1573 domain-containing protein [Deltaproteobacteria bacterium]